jgi:hypothetical protein
MGTWNGAERDLVILATQDSGLLGREVETPLFELARMLVCFYHVTSRIVNANHGIM